MTATKSKPSRNGRAANSRAGWATLRAMAADCDVTPKTASEWKAKDGFPAGPPYPVGEVLAWLKMVNSPSAAVTEAMTPDMAQRKAAAELAKLEADVQWRELRNKEKEGETVDRQEARRELQQGLTTMKTRLESIPDAVELEVPRQYFHLADMNRRLIHAALHELADTLGSGITSGPEDKDDDPSWPRCGNEYPNPKRRINEHASRDGETPHLPAHRGPGAVARNPSGRGRQ